MSSSCTSGHRHGFTLVELLVSMVIVALLAALLTSITNSVGRIWSQSTAKAEQFRDAREAFDSVTRKLSQVTLNPYLDYVDSSGNFRTASNAFTTPYAYKRRSDLRFISGNAATLVGESTYSTGGTNQVSIAPPHAIFFQAPLGAVTDSQYTDLGNVINTVGYFIEYGDDSLLRPTFLSNMNPSPPLKFRFRLMEMVEPSNSLTIYKYTSPTSTSASPNYTGTDWFTVPFKQTSASVPARPVSVLAENIVALIILPQLSPADQQNGGYTPASLAPTYMYDSTGTNMTTVSDAYLNPTNQLPPVVQVTMVAVDEVSFLRTNPGATMPTYTTNLFTDPKNLSTDLDYLQANLLNKSYVADGTPYAPTTANSGQPPLNYRIFTTNVSVKAAKWSQVQTH